MNTSSERNNSINSDFIRFSKTSEELPLQSPYEYILKGRMTNKKLSVS